LTLDEVLDSETIFESCTEMFSLATLKTDYQLAYALHSPAIKKMHSCLAYYITR